MAKSILSISRDKEKKVFILIGIDEFKNADFISRYAISNDILPPVFLFNKIVPGYGVSKMGKSTPYGSFTFSDSYIDEYKKILPYISEENHNSSERCALCDLVYFSGYPVDVMSKSGIEFAHNNSKEIIEKILFCKYK